MNSADPLAFDLIRRDQRRVHLLVDELDRRIDLLAERGWETPVPPRAAAPPPLPKVEAPPPVIPAPVVEEVAAAPIAAARAPAEPPPPPPPSAPAESLELRVGTYWMSRIGMAILLTGLVFLGNYAYHRIVPVLGPWGKLSLLALAGVALGGLGAWMERSRENLRNFGRVLLAGGAATIYYTVYAAHFVSGLRVVESPIVGGGLLLVLAGVFVWQADRRRSQAIALPAVLLAYYTSAINPIGSFSLFSSLLLTGTAVFFLVRHRWTQLSHAALAGTYGAYAYWRFHQVVQTGSGSEFGVGLAFVAGYWVLFTVAAFLAAPEAMRGPQRMAFLTANNGAFFAFAAQHFAVHRWEGFWIFALGYGAVLLGLAALAARLRAEERSLSGACLAQGLALVTLGLAARLTGPQLAVVLAVESAVLLTGSRRRHGLLFQVAAVLCALGASGLAFCQPVEIRMRVLSLSAPVAALLFFDAWWVKRLCGEFERFGARAFAFAALGLITTGGMIHDAVSPPWQPAVFALAAGASLLALRARLPEVAFPGQFFLLVGAGDFISRHLTTAPAPWWSPAPVVLVALALMHWWQRQRAFPVAKEVRAFAEYACALAGVIGGVVWMRDFHYGDSWLITTSLAAFGLLVYGLCTRSQALAITSQLFSLLAAGSFALALYERHPAWAAAAAPLLNVALTSVLVTRRPAVRSSAMLSSIAEGYRLAALAMFGAWGFGYVPAPWHVAFFAGTGAALILAGAAGGNRERVQYGGIYAAVALALFCGRFWNVPTLPDLLGILIIPASLRLSRRLATETLLPAARDPLVVAALVSLWLWVTRWTPAHGDASHLTIAWAVLALVIFAAGLGLQERIYRVGGFAVLGLAVGRLFIVDVQRFDSLGRILSFLVLGVVLLVLSFVYHRFAETIRRWL